MRRELQMPTGILQKIVIIAIICLSFSTGLAQETNTSGITIEKGVMCQDVVDRTPIGTGDIFPKDTQKLYCFTKVVGAQSQTTITHLWYQNGQLQSKVTLPVNSASWRTWSSLEMFPERAGEWMVEVVSEQGIALDNIIFLVR